MKKAIDQAKELIKAIQENPSQLDELQKNIKGVHAPYTQTTHYQRGRADRGVSFAGSHARSGEEPHNKFSSASGNDIAKQIHKEKLAEIKSMPKPQLGKDEINLAEANPHEKGVHQPAGAAQTSLTNEKQGGVSDAGLYSRKAVPMAHSHNLTARAKHLKNLLELKRMPAPNLPKAEANPDAKQDAALGEKVEHLVEGHMSANKQAEAKEGHSMAKKECAKCGKECKCEMAKAELNKAKVDEGKTDAQKRSARLVGSGHRSGGGQVFDASQGPKVRGGHMSAAKQVAKETLARIKSMPKPNLGKAKLEEGTPADYKQDIRASRQMARPTIQPTIHEPFMSQEGMSQAGSATMGAHKSGITGMGGEDMRQMLLAKAKELHQKVLSGIKSQKAPDLGKGSAAPAATPAPAPRPAMPAKAAMPKPKPAAAPMLMNKDENGDLGSKNLKEHDPLKDAPELKEINPEAASKKKEEEKK